MMSIGFRGSVEDIQPMPGLFSISCLDPSYYI